MAIRYFKKFSPENNPVLANGSKVLFTSLDHLIGWLATDNEYVQGELERFMREQRYGLTEVSAQEFKDEYLEKKNQTPTNSRGNWREEWGKTASALTPIQRLGVEKVAAVVGVENPAEAKPVQPQPVTASEPATGDKPKEEFKPTVGKRIKKGPRSEPPEGMTPRK